MELVSRDLRRVAGLRLLFAVGTDPSESAADVVIAELVEGVGAQAVLAGVISESVVTIDDQIEVEVGKLVTAVLKKLGVMLDGLGCNLLEGEILIAATLDGREVESASVTLKIPMRIE